MSLSRKAKVVQLQSSIETGNPAPLAYIDATRYTQHNLGVGDGLAAILAVHESLPKETTRARPIRALEDGDFAVAHVEYDLWGPKVGFDVHRFDGDLIVEHWDNLQELAPAPNPSGHTMLDGPRCCCTENTLVATPPWRWLTCTLASWPAAFSAPWADGQRWPPSSPGPCSPPPMPPPTSGPPRHHTGKHRRSLPPRGAPGSTVAARSRRGTRSRRVDRRAAAARSAG
jgi:predicted SnoaL-like aldol condensation-catalyzing enzyme